MAAPTLLKAQLPDEWHKMLSSRERIESGHIVVKMKKLRPAETPSSVAAIKLVEDSIFYSFTFDKECLAGRYRLDSAGGENPFEYRFSVTPDVTRVMPNYGNTINDEFRIRSSEVASLNRGIENYRFNFRAIGLVFNSFTSLRKDGLEYVRFYEKLPVSVRSEVTGGIKFKVCSFGGEPNTVEYWLDPETPYLPTNVQLVVGRGEKTAVAMRTQTQWQMVKGTDIYFPSKTIWEHFSEGACIGKEESIIEIHEANQIIDRSAFDWEGLGIQKGQVVRTNDGTPEQMWNGSTFVEYKPRLLHSANTSRPNRLWYVVLIGVPLVCAVLGFRFRNQLK